MFTSKSEYWVVEYEMLVIGMSRNETFLTNIASYCVLCLCTWQYQNFSWMYQQICFSFLSPPMCWNRVIDAAIHGIKIDLIQLLFYIYPCKHWNEVMKLLINAQQLVPSSNLYTLFSISVKVLNLNHICCYKWLKNWPHPQSCMQMLHCHCCFYLW